MSIERSQQRDGAPCAGGNRPAVHLIDATDDVVVALVPLGQGETVEAGGRRIEVREPIPAGHKLAVRAVATGGEVRKYGWPIGRATRDIEAGVWVHTHNLATQLSGVTNYHHLTRR